MAKTSKFLLWCVCAGSVMTACAEKKPAAAKLKMDSAHTIGLDALIEEGRIITQSSDVSSIEYEVREQLYYAIGQLNGLNSGADMAQVVVSDIKTATDASGAVVSATYKASMRVAWAREMSIPRTFSFILPESGTYNVLSEFFQKYSDDCVDPSAHDNSAFIFWYYYRPQNCQLGQVESAPLATRVVATFKPSVMNTTGKYPEYDKVWEDQKLVVTAIFGKAESRSTSDYDGGVAAYNQFYSDLIRRFGNPSYISVPLRRRTLPGLANPSLHIVWNNGNTSIDVSMHIIEGIQEVGQEFIEVYNERTKNSDLVTYSGHSGLGANIRALANLGSFQQGQYQIYLVNGCDTFAYTDKALENAHQAVNPSAAGTKYFDMITNAMPSYFYANSKTNMVLINALMGKELTYRQILANFDVAQRSVVTGEEDNKFPNPFD